MFNDFYFGIEYNTFSSYDKDEPSRYISDFEGKILLLDLNDSIRDVVGKFRFFYLNLILARQENFCIYELFDWDIGLSKIGEYLMDYSTENFTREVTQQYGKKFIKKNLMVLDYIEIIENCRGLELGKMALKDMIDRFGHQSCLLALEIFYPQHGEESFYQDQRKKWLRQLKWHKLEQDPYKSSVKLTRYFKSLGFDNFLGEKVFTLNLMKKNPIDRFNFKPI